MADRCPRFGAYAPRVERLDEGTRDERRLYGRYGADDEVARELDEEELERLRGRRRIKMEMPVRLQRQIDDLHAHLTQHCVEWMVRSHKTPAALMKMAVQLGLRKMRGCPDAEAVDALIAREQHNGRQVRVRARKRITKKIRAQQAADEAVREAVRCED